MQKMYLPDGSECGGSRGDGGGAGALERGHAARGGRAPRRRRRAPRRPSAPRRAARQDTPAAEGRGLPEATLVNT